MRTLILALALGVFSCAIHPGIFQLNQSPPQVKSPIIYGGISGIPNEYAFTLYFEHKNPKGKINWVSEQFYPMEQVYWDRVHDFSLVLPPGRWTLKQIELRGIEPTGEFTPLTHEPKRIEAVFAMQDSLRTPFAFDVAEGKVHYLGRWHFNGFEAIKTFLPDAIAQYKTQNTILKKPIKHEIALSIAITDSMASDRLIFEENYPTHGVKESEATLPLHPFSHEKHVFTLLIQPLNPSGFWFQNHQPLHLEMHLPKIPKL